MYPALLMFAQAAGYIHVLWSGAAYTTSYSVQARLMPLWGYAALLVATGGLLLRTVNHRRTWYARSVAGAGFVLQLAIAGGFWAAGGYSGWWWGVVICGFLLIESMWIRNREGD
jgi:hypothetical protein